jgi:UPF0271 protein
MIRAVRKFDPELIVVFNANSAGLAFARSQGLRAAGEGYIDRGYEPSGRLVARDHPRALLEDVAQIRSRVVDMVCRGEVSCVDGTTIGLDVETICLHSDTPGAGTFGAEVVAALKNERVAIKPLAELLG